MHKCVLLFVHSFDAGQMCKTKPVLPLLLHPPRPHNKHSCNCSYNACQMSDFPLAKLHLFSTSMAVHVTQCMVDVEARTVFVVTTHDKCESPAPFPWSPERNVLHSQLSSYLHCTPAEASQPQLRARKLRVNPHMLTCAHGLQASGYRPRMPTPWG